MSPQPWIKPHYNNLHRLQNSNQQRGAFADRPHARRAATDPIVSQCRNANNNITIIMGILSLLNGMSRKFCPHTLTLQFGIRTVCSFHIHK